MGKAAKASATARDQVVEASATFAELALALERGDLELAAGLQRRLAGLGWQCRPTGRGVAR